MDPVFWLGLSILLVAVSITAVLMAALPAFQELSRAARSAEKLFDTLNRELPPTLEAIRLTSLEITELTDDMTEGMQNVGRMTQQVDQGMSGVKQQAKQAQITTRSVVAGFKAALGAFARSPGRRADPVQTRPSLPRSEVEEFEEIEEADRAEDFQPENFQPEDFQSENFQPETVPLSEKQNPLRRVSPSLEEPANTESSEILAEKNGANQTAIDSTAADSTETPRQNGTSHAPQLRSSSSPPLNLPSASPQKPQPIEARREHQG